MLTVTAADCHIHSMAMADIRWTLDELNAQAVRALGDGAARELGPRTLRYYATLGLLDRPSAMRGRQAFYGERHLLQLVAIKRLQALGLTLADVQARLRGAGTTALQGLAALPDGFVVGDASVVVSDRDDEEFWARTPMSEVNTPRAQLVTVPLDPAVTLNLASHHALSSADLDAVHAAAAELLRVLRARGLIAQDPHDRSHR
jgi:DNA-binding transcriptional MerR regulator